MIEIKNLTKRYGRIHAVDDISFEVNKGEVVGFLGPNGAGKTTTMKMISGFMGPSSGEVKLDGLDVFDNPIEVKKRIGYLPETPPLYLEQRVEEYLNFVANIKLTPKDQIRKLVDNAIEKTNLGEVKNRIIGHLSKGFRQRVGIAQALVSNPKVLILDEPTVGLDPRQVAEVRELIKSLRGEHTIILSTHILPEVQATCERIIIINKGKIVAKDSLEELTKKVQGHKSLEIRVLDYKKDIEEELMSLDGVYSIHSQANGKGTHLTLEFNGSEELQSDIASRVVKKGLGLLELKAASVNLEDIFIKLTNRDSESATSDDSEALS